jgi:flagellar hook-associated protein 2
MAVGSLSSLGIASGVLTYDVIDKLKKADESTMIDPFKKRLDDIKGKESALTDLITQISLFKTSISDFQNGDIFQKRVVDTNGSSVSADVNDGVAVQKVKLNVTQLAQNDIYQSKGFSSDTTAINNTGETQTLTLNYGGVETDISLENGATLTDLRDKINDANIGVTASIIDTGNSDNPYKLILKGNETGTDNIIKLDYGTIDNLGFNATNYTSKTYDADTDSVNESGETQTFKVSINGTDYSMNVDDGESVSDFIDAINNGDLKDSDGNSLNGISASYENGQIKFNLQDIGDISIDDTGLNTAFNDNTDFTNDNRVQEAKNSEFTYNGVEITRSSNDVDDLLIGATFHLQNKGETTIDIKQDKDSINQAVTDFVSGYNSLVSKIQDLTKYNKDTKEVGIFQNETLISSIPRDINSTLFDSFTTDIVTKKDKNGQEYDSQILLNASDFGFTMNRTGFLDFDSSKFSDMLKNKPEEVEKFLSGDNGAFTKIIDKINSLIKGPNSSLELLSKQYTNQEDSYEDLIDRTQQQLDAKYQTMAMQFSSYDEMINNYTIQSQTLQNEIDAMIAAKK